MRCGNISVSQNKSNYYVSDYVSIKNIIIPIFDFFHLNSTKYSQFNIFKEAAELIYNKSHLTDLGLSRLIYLKSIANIDSTTPESFNITANWLLGFIEGDATFSTYKIRPRLRFECHSKEEKLFIKIQEFLKIGKVVKSIRIRDKIYYSVILDIFDIYYLKLIIVPLFKNLNFHTKKYLDFCNWCYIVDFYYWGYHLIPVGKDLILEIKSIMNKGRLINRNKNLNKEDMIIKINNLLNKPSPYVIKNDKRKKRIQENKTVYRKYKKITVLNTTNNKESIFKNITEVTRTLKISNVKIKSILNTGLVYKNYIFYIYK